MIEPTRSGICCKCDEYSKELYTWDYWTEYGKAYEDICHSCYPKCERCNCEFIEVDGTDLCKSCDDEVRSDIAYEEDNYTISDRDAWKHEAAAQQRLK